MALSGGRHYIRRSRGGATIFPMASSLISEPKIAAFQVSCLNESNGVFRTRLLAFSADFDRVRGIDINVCRPTAHDACVVHPDVFVTGAYYSLWACHYCRSERRTPMWGGSGPPRLPPHSGKQSVTVGKQTTGIFDGHENDIGVEQRPAAR